MAALTPEIRPATAADCAAVTTLLVTQLREHRIVTAADQVARTVARVLARPRQGRLLVATVDGRPVGVAALSFAWPIEHGGRSMWLEELFVEPPHRGRGIGRALLAAAERLAVQAGAVAIDLEVDAEHQRAAGLYARAGFRPLPRVHWVRSLEPGEPTPAAPPAETIGGCFCGAIRYRVASPPREVTHCHCSICRRTSGAPFVTWATFPAASFAFTQGQPVELCSTPRACRTLCAACGTALTFREEARPRAIDVTVGSTDHPDAVVPQAHIWTTSQLPWLHLDDDLPRHPGEDPGEREVPSTGRSP